MDTNREKPIVKVCKIDSINFASYEIKQGVDFLGVHVLTENDIGKHKELTEFIINNSGRAIIVTKIESADVLERLIESYKPSGIQLHFDTKPLVTERIKKRFPNLILIGVITNQSKYLDFDVMNKLYDYLIYDCTYYNSESPYVKEMNDYRFLNSFSQKLQQKTLLAGKISIEKIMKLAHLNAGGYDIQSYFRSNSGLNYRNLDKVCDVLKSPRSNKLSISLTDISLTDIYRVSSYYKTANLEYHLDVSDGSLYPEFNTKKMSIEEKKESLAQLPFSVHLFIKDIEQIKNKVKRLSQKYALNLIRIFVQYFEGVDEKIFVNHEDNIHVIPSIFYKDLQLFLDKEINGSILSIVVPRAESVANVEGFFKTIIANRKYLENKEIWFDRNLDLTYIELLKSRSWDGYFNFIVGKEVIKDWSKIDLINERLLK
jgi:phosphoribosylanthranilate isomerase